jgi:hypothetical protein
MIKPHPPFATSSWKMIVRWLTDPSAFPVLVSVGAIAIRFLTMKSPILMGLNRCGNSFKLIERLLRSQVWWLIQYTSSLHVPFQAVNEKVALQKAQIVVRT